ncbi:MAG TPA: hypothetical protein VGQ28_00035 [Thermoanaerobaculia bacterium]|jgi:hypothetical protein|nr:hypothetical protein [Thermoanaerobaculia bacterium]
MICRTPTLRLLVVLLALFAAMPASSASSSAGDREEFFILSSMDAARGRIVLKRPTEVTLVMQVNGQTAYRDEQGKALRLADLRTGDTLYITFRQSPAGEPTALRVRLGPMTVQELRRYLKPGTS